MRILFPTLLRWWHRLRRRVTGVGECEQTVSEMVVDLTRSRDSEELLESLRWWRHRLGERSWMVPSSRSSLGAYAGTAVAGRM